MKHTLITSITFGVVALSASFALAADQQNAQTQVQERAQNQVQEQIYGSQLMTNQERLEYQARIHTAKTAEERERIRADHHKLMQERAKVRGVTLPDMPPPMGGGMGPGPAGPGSGGRGR